MLLGPNFDSIPGFMSGCCSEMAVLKGGLARDKVLSEKFAKCLQATLFCTVLTMACDI
jgi:hypothetical protein